PHRPRPGRPCRLAPRGDGARRGLRRDRQEERGVSALRRWIVAGIVLLLGRGRRPPWVERERLVPPGEPSPQAELVVLALFGATAACAIAFVVVYAVESIPHQTQFLGLSLGLAFAFLAAALIVIAYRLVVTEELEEDYPVPAHPAEQEALGQLVEESGDRMTRKRLLLVGGGAAGAAPGAAHGIVAYSKICTHAGCAVALYRKPTFPTVEPRPALVCPCHYSTFDPARGAKVLFGPAGRPLPQLPLFVGPSGELRAAGNLSGPVGPAWWGVRNRRPS